MSYEEPHSSHYRDLTDNDAFEEWNKNFVATSIFHHTELVLNEEYVPQNDEEVAVLAEMESFMFDVFKTHIKTTIGKSLIIKYKTTRDAKGIYRGLIEHATMLKANRKTGETMLLDIMTTRYPGIWDGTSFEFVVY